MTGRFALPPLLTVAASSSDGGGRGVVAALGNRRHCAALAVDPPDHGEIPLLHQPTAAKHQRCLNSALLAYLVILCANAEGWGFLGSSEGSYHPIAESRCTVGKSRSVTCRKTRETPPLTETGSEGAHASACHSVCNALAAGNQCLHSTNWVLGRMVVVRMLVPSPSDYCVGSWGEQGH
ncbi:uncharacterized protein B0H64DRAFT_129485 [Chaetomium fimeti]|uniref:Uncharacterized protein n=1 Tax=Chaetomium fimeti TaxID=1854472 RepID=A0AAE0HJG9_9PEZI|nr:hypothetical protein B0H64DRAFT_129485 [Chaetomium fimeti]